VNNPKKVVKEFRIIALIEGWSYLILLFISMPLKYIFSIKQPVMINGWIHGLLFVAFAILLLRVWYIRKWPFKKAFIAGIASLIPFGTFWFDKELKKEEKSL
jgi:integral membrane protein